MIMLWTRPYLESNQWQAFFHAKARDIFKALPRDQLEEVVQDAQVRLLERLRRMGKQAVRDNDKVIGLTYKRLLLDIYREHYGRRPAAPDWVAALGPLGLRVWELYCLARLPLASIYARLSVGREDLDIRDLEAQVEALRSSRACPEEAPRPVERTVSMTVRDEQGETQRELADPAAGSPEDLAAEARVLLQAILGWSAGQDAELMALSAHLAHKARAIREALQLSDDERLLLRLRYQEGLGVAQVARTTGMQYHNARRGLQRVEARIREAFARQGIHFSDLVG